MKTYKNREGKYVSEEPKSFYVGIDSHGDEVFTGDRIYDNKWKRVYKIDNVNYVELCWTLQRSVLMKHGLIYKIAR